MADNNDATGKDASSWYNWAASTAASSVPMIKEQSYYVYEKAKLVAPYVQPYITKYPIPSSCFKWAVTTAETNVPMVKEQPSDVYEKAKLIAHYVQPHITKVGQVGFSAVQHVASVRDMSWNITLTMSIGNKMKKDD